MQESVQSAISQAKILEGGEKMILPQWLNDLKLLLLFFFFFGGGGWL